MTRGDRIGQVLTAVPFALGLIAASVPSAAQPPAQDLAHPQGTNAGIFAFTGRCATCHDTGKGGATDRYALNRYTPEEVLAAAKAL